MSEYRAFVSRMMAKLPGSMAPKDKMRKIGQMWRNRKGKAGGPRRRGRGPMDIPDTIAGSGGDGRDGEGENDFSGSGYPDENFSGGGLSGGKISHLDGKDYPDDWSDDEPLSKKRKARSDKRYMGKHLRIAKQDKTPCGKNGHLVQEAFVPGYKRKGYRR